MRGKVAATLAPRHVGAAGSDVPSTGLKSRAFWSLNCKTGSLACTSRSKLQKAGNSWRGAGVLESTGTLRSEEMSAIIPGVSSAGRESFSIAVVSRAELSECAPWTSTFCDQRKDYRYYEILDDTLRG